jgi:tyrosyl-tRNA synthetase
MPLVTTAAGTKFGKTEAGAVWLDPSLTKPYEFYQFWLNVDDRDAGRYLKYFTFFDRERVSDLEAVSIREPERRHTQRELAREVTRLVHGEEAVRDAESSTEKLFKGDLRAMTEAQLLEVFGNVPSSEMTLALDGWAIADFLAANAVVGSKSEATRLIRGGGLSVNGERVSDEKARLRPEDAIHGRYFVIRKGKKDNHLVRLRP